MLYLKKVDPRVINYLLQNDKFAAATRSMALYFTNSIARMIITQNHLLNNSFGIVDELINTGKIPNDRQMKDLKRNLKAAKLPPDTYEIDRIDRQLMAAVREIKKKTMTEVADRLENENILDYEVMAKVKEEILASPSMNDLTDEEKLVMIKNTIMDGILVYADLDEKKIALIDPLVEQIALLLIEIWKEF